MHTISLLLLSASAIGLLLYLVQLLALSWPRRSRPSSAGPRPPISILRPLCGAQETATWVPKRPCGVEAAFSVGFSHDTAETYLYVADGGTHVITVLRRRDLEVMDEFAGPGVGPGQLGRPHNLTVDPSGNIYVAEAAGPKVKDPKTGDEVQAGFRAQKFAFKGSR